MLVVSLRVYIAGFGLFKGVWDGTSLYFPIQVSVRAVHEELYKNVVTLIITSEKQHDIPDTRQNTLISFYVNVCFCMTSFRCKLKIEQHPHWSPLGV